MDGKMKPIYLSQHNGPFEVGDRVYEDIDELMEDIEPDLMSLRGLPEKAIAYTKAPFYVPTIEELKVIEIYDEDGAQWVTESYFDEYLSCYEWPTWEPPPSYEYEKASQDLEDAVAVWQQINRGIIALSQWLQQNRPKAFKVLGRDALPTLCDWVLRDALAKFEAQAGQECYQFKSAKQEIILEYPADWIVEMARNTKPSTISRKETIEDIPEHLRQYLKPETKASLTP